MRIDLALVASQSAQRSGRDRDVRLTQRLFLYPNELYRVPPSYRQVRTRHGIAHISQSGKDFIIRPGELLNLERGTDAALVSALHSESLVLELFQ
jgi:hypothetical protein